MLVRNTEKGGPGKIRSYWEDKVYKVVKQIEDWPVYEIIPDNGAGRKRVVHRNMLTQCDELPVVKDPDKLRTRDVGQKTRIRIEKKQTKLRERRERLEGRSKASSSSDSLCLTLWDCTKLDEQGDGREEAGFSTESSLDSAQLQTGMEGSDKTEKEIDSTETEIEELSRVEDAVGEEPDVTADSLDLSTGVPESEYAASESSDSSERRGLARGRPTRQRRAPLRMTYDTAGNPSFEPQAMRLAVLEEPDDQATEMGKQEMLQRFLSGEYGVEDCDLGSISSTIANFEEDITPHKSTTYWRWMRNLMRMMSGAGKLKFSLTTSGRRGRRL